MKSEWIIHVDGNEPLESCFVDYKIEMEFNSYLFSALTRQFFDILVSQVDQEFADRCEEITKLGKYSDEYKYTRVSWNLASQINTNSPTTN